jgi:diadenosine tetraphosphate (Ap4A) HIT family hydrolase
MLGPVTPPTDVDAPDVADAAHRPLDPRQHPAHLGGNVSRQVSGLGQVRARFHNHHERHARGRQRLQAPAIIGPEVVAVWADAAAAAVAAAFAGARLLGGEWRQEFAQTDVAGERHGVPLCERGHPQRILGACEQLLGRLGYRVAWYLHMQWPLEFYPLRDGDGCPFCADGRPDQNEHGVRFFAGRWCDAYLQRAAIQRGYSVVVWRGRHVAEPTELTADEAAGFWAEILQVGRALEAHFCPVKLNYELLGNSLPHLHAHVIPRYAEDPKPAWPFPFPPEPHAARGAAELRGDVDALSRIVGTER